MSDNGLNGLDLTIFESNESVNKCDGNTKCLALQRMCVGLKYYEMVFDDESAIKMSKEEKEKLFIHFNETVYKQTLLNDYIHIITKHNTTQQIMAIKNELQTKYNIQPCNVSKCVKLSRHYRRRGTQTNETLNEKNRTKQDSKYEFYCDTYHKFHHQIFHLFQMGLRCLPTENEQKEMEETVNNDTDSIGLSFIDETFKNKRDLLTKQRKQCQSNDFSERYNDTNNKFNIQINTKNQQKSDNKEQNSENTFLDGMYEYMKQQNTDINLEKIQKYVNENEYDSDALKQDLSDLSSSKTSNICNNIGYKVCNDLKANWIRNIECM